MGAIPAAIRTLLKSRSMVGSDAPNAMLRFLAAEFAGEVDRELTGFSNPFGMGFDPSARELIVTGASNRLYRVNPVTGAVGTYITVRANAIGLEVDAGDPTVVWVAHGDSGIGKYNLSTGVELTFFSLEAGVTSYNGLAAPPGLYLWVGDAPASAPWRLLKVRKSDGLIESAYSWAFRPSGVAWDGFWVWVSGYSTTVRAFNPPTEAVVMEFTGPTAAQTSLTYDGFCLWTGDNTNSKLLRYKSSVLPIRPEKVSLSWLGASLAQRCSAAWPNVNPDDHQDPGYYSPDRGDNVPAKKNEWYHVLYPGREFSVELGYGTQLRQVFRGEIDDTDLQSDPADYKVAVDGRDLGCRLIDRTITNDLGGYTITYTDEPVEDIVRDLLIRAGWLDGEISTEPTGFTVTVTFERQSYADGVEWCMEVTGFELIIDEQGLPSFHYPTDRDPAADDEAVELNGTDPVDLAHSPIVTGSEVVTDATGTVTYSPDTDYLMDYATGTVARRVGSTIGDGDTVLVDYVYAQWTFREGEDIFTFRHRITRRNVYGKIRMTGQKADESLAIGTYTYAGSEVYGIPADRVLFAEAQQLDTDAKCQAAADQMGNDMVRRVREISFAAVANPWVRVGHCIQAIDSASTTSEIYRITSLSFDFGPDGAIMEGTANHYGHAPLT